MNMNMNLVSLFSKLFAKGPKTSATGIAAAGLAIASVFVKDPGTKNGLVTVAIALAGAGLTQSADSGTPTTPVVLSQRHTPPGSDLVAGVATVVKAVEEK